MSEQKTLFEDMPIPKAYMKLAVPVILGMVVSLVYNLTDTYFISLAGDTDLIAGIALCGPVFSIQIGLGDVFGVGGSSLISRLLGKGEESRAKNISAFCFYAALGLGLVYALILLIFDDSILMALGTDADTLPHASAYYHYLLLGAPVQILCTVPLNLLRTEGLSNDSMIGSVIGTVTNIVLDPVFIYLLRLGSAGAAIATDIGHYATAGYYIFVMLKKSRKLSIDPRQIRIGKKDLGSLLAIGVPSCVTSLLSSFGSAMLNRALLGYGNDRVAVMGISGRISSIPLMVLIGFAFGGQPLVGYNYGKGSQKHLKAIFRFAYTAGILLALGMELVIIALARPLIRIFLKDPDLIALGIPILRIQSTTMFLQALVLVTTCCFQAMGRALSALILSVCRQGLLLYIFLPILSSVFGYMGIICTQPVCDITAAVIAVCLMIYSFRKDPVLSGKEPQQASV